MEAQFLQQRRGSKCSRYTIETFLNGSSKLGVFDREANLMKANLMIRFNAATERKKRGLQCFDVKYNYFEV